jgi:hypothetical protein
MNWSLVRFLGVWAVLVGTALAALHHPAPPPGDPAWLLESPRRTAGCPALRPHLAAWQRELSLEAWSLEIVCGILDREGEILLGRVVADSSSKEAKIWVREGLSPGLQQAVIVHELAHVGVDAGRWWVPDGLEEETFVLAAADRVYFARRYDVLRRMLHELRLRARDLRAAGSPPAVRAFALADDSPSLRPGRGTETRALPAQRRRSKSRTGAAS